MVLTGVNNARDAIFARPEQRPTYIGHDLRSLRQDGKLLAVGPQPGWQVDVGDHAVTVSGIGSDDPDGLSIVRAVASAVWGAQSPDLGGPPVRIEAGDGAARDALQRWSLLHDA